MGPRRGQIKDSEKVVELMDCKSRCGQRVAGVRVLEGGNQKKIYWWSKQDA